MPKEYGSPNLTEAFAADVSTKNEGHRDAPAAPVVAQPAAFEKKPV